MRPGTHAEQRPSIDTGAKDGGRTGFAPQLAKAELTGESNTGARINGDWIMETYEFRHSKSE